MSETEFGRCSCFADEDFLTDDNAAEPVRLRFKSSFVPRLLADIVSVNKKTIKYINYTNYVNVKKGKPVVIQRKHEIHVIV